MKIKTNLPHERKGGCTTVMFGEPILKQVIPEKVIAVEFAIIKTVKNKENDLIKNSYFQPKLLKFQEKRILKYAEKLVRKFIKENKMSIKKTDKMCGSLLLIKGGGNHCNFYFI